jgi:hypothetical protein
MMYISYTVEIGALEHQFDHWFSWFDILDSRLNFMAVPFWPNMFWNPKSHGFLIWRTYLGEQTGDSQPQVWPGGFSAGWQRVDSGVLTRLAFGSCDVLLRKPFFFWIADVLLFHGEASWSFILLDGSHIPSLIMIRRELLMSSPIFDDETRWKSHGQPPFVNVNPHLFEFGAVRLKSGAAAALAAVQPAPLLHVGPGPGPWRGLLGWAKRHPTHRTCRHVATLEPWIYLDPSDCQGLMRDLPCKVVI